MIGDITKAQGIYIVCGYTDMRKSINGLASIVQSSLGLDPFSRKLFLFCGKRADRMKVLLWEDDGFVLLYKRLENGKFKWPRTEEQVRDITWQEFRWLTEGLAIDQPKAIKKAKTGDLC
ncbi:IS66 Orf2 like protein [Oxobacter pfennigii]|uniref:IS66 Orf2 like protein n=1 Tax=Oxobacter pfennigii TaxID=36849 RepID=A0A0P8W4W9_9CLOT|nr:IS66 family insertion sequence element accessory protein TnpB [Oxobacter pfennigii]KPU42596.1 IS66 Orf2 like protein [Oxobacter pfennigii]